MMKLNGKVAIVTGGARDIGRAVSVKLAQEGAKVVVNYNSSLEQAEETLALIKKAGGEGILVKADITKREEVVRLVTETKRAFGHEIHILANVAGGMVARKLITDMEEEFWDQVITLNVK